MGEKKERKKKGHFFLTPHPKPQLGGPAEKKLWLRAGNETISSRKKARRYHLDLVS